jgi:hypothetical protein
MVDPISAISGGITIAGGILQFLNYIQSVAGTNVISAYFRYDGTKVEGNEKIEIELIPDEHDKDVSWLTVKPVDDYVFIRIPTNESCVHELIAKKESEKSPDPHYWRWIAKPQPNILISGDNVSPNVKMDFIIVGYQPKALVKQFNQQI